MKTPFTSIRVKMKRKPEEKSRINFLAHQNLNQIDWKLLQIGLAVVISLKPGKVAKLASHRRFCSYVQHVNGKGDSVGSIFVSRIHRKCSHTQMTFTGQLPIFT